MGAVYHVWDSELALSLALKVIKPDNDPVATQELERRFKRELVLARQVTHTNVIRIHDLGEIDGIKYITMPFVHGTDLARLLSSEGKLPVARALPVARQMVSGLRAAHEAGIVHRDLKPANILIDDTEKAVITDFGIARSTDAGTFATAAGAIIGTLPFDSSMQRISNFLFGQTGISGTGTLATLHFSGIAPAELGLQFILSAGTPDDDILGFLDSVGNFIDVAPIDTTPAPVPEPSTLGLLGVGLLAMARRLRRRSPAGNRTI